MIGTIRLSFRSPGPGKTIPARGEPGTAVIARLPIGGCCQHEAEEPSAVLSTRIRLCGRAEVGRAQWTHPVLKDRTCQHLGERTAADDTFNSDSILV